MGRAGAGGGGGHISHSGSGHRAGRSGSGHRVGSSSASHRPGSGLNSYSSRQPSRPRHHEPMGGPGMPPPPPRRGPGMPPPPPRGGYGYRRTYHGGNGLGCGGTIASMLALVVLCIVLVFAFNAVNNRTGYSDNSSTISTIERTKLDSKDPYMKDCIVDELGWINNVSYTSNKLSTFWEQTGVQPYIVLRAYDPNLKNDEMKEEWAKQYYDSHFTAENIYLYVYFAEFNENEVGYSYCVNGKETEFVMDNEAQDIFWKKLDYYWGMDENEISTDDVFINAFNDTAKIIMKKHTTPLDVTKWVIIFAVVGVAGVTVVTLVKQKNKRAKEKAEEERRILETPIHDMAQNDLESKYLQK